MPFPFLALLGVQSSPITVNTLLSEMVDLRSLAQRPKMHFKEAQFSSYDRRSVTPGNADWFANDDWGKYVRDETIGGRTEHVMADIKGPGTITRIWTANPSGSLRFYFDGHSEPDLVAPMKELLNGKFGVIGDPYAYPAAHGFDMYFPIPFGQGCKVTVDDNPPGWDHLYYHVGYRVYDPGTQVQTFAMNQVDPNVLRLTGIVMQNRQPVNEQFIDHHASWRVAAGKTQSLEVNAKNPEAFMQFYVKVTPQAHSDSWTDPHQMHNILRHLILEMEFDGNECVRAPVGDFFADVPTQTPYDSLPMAVGEDGQMECRYVMPFSKKAVIRIRNVGPVSADVKVQAYGQPYEFDDGTYLFHSQWKPELGSTRPLRDMEFLNAAGEGRYVGTALAVRNPVTGWWGEGDEKVYIDGEAFPSTFGTGTEDYFGYAWSSNIAFDHPYNGQPHADKPVNYGYSCQHRWHIFDSFPFDRHFRFDLEEWHSADVDCSYWGTTYWYARPGSTPAVGIVPADLELRELPPVEHVKGAIEGESLNILEKTGGTTEVQEEFMECSGAAQLWWHQPKLGDHLVLEVNAPSDGLYQVSGHFCYAPDYGTHEIFFAGKDLGKFDFYEPKLTWKMVDLGQVSLKKGANKFEVTVREPNALMVGEGNMFGLDYLTISG